MRATFLLGTTLGGTSTPLVGLRTGDNTRFIRQWWEVARDKSAFSCDSTCAAEATDAKWFPYNKGGSFRRWYGNQEYLVNWENDGKEVEEGLAKRYPYLVPAGKTLVRGQGRDQYFSPAVSWSDISSGAPSFRYFPEGFVHGNKGNSIFGFPRHLKQLLGIMNSTCVTRFLDALAPTMTASVGDVAKTPIPRRLVELSVSAIEALETTSKVDWETAETAWGFDYNPLVTTARVPRN